VRTGIWIVARRSRNRCRPCRARRANARRHFRGDGEVRRSERDRRRVFALVENAVVAFAFEIPSVGMAYFRRAITTPVCAGSHHERRLSPRSTNATSRPHHTRAENRARIAVDRRIGRTPETTSNDKVLLDSKRDSFLWTATSWRLGVQARF